MPKQTLTNKEQMFIRLSLEMKLKEYRDSVAYWTATQPSYAGLTQLIEDVDTIECLMTMFYECDEVHLTDVVRKNVDGTVREAVS